MKKNYLFIIIFLLFSLGNILCEDGKSENDINKDNQFVNFNKAYDITIGCSFIPFYHSVRFSAYYEKYKLSYSFLDNFTYSTEYCKYRDHLEMPHICMGLNFVFSYSYFFNNKTSIGFTLDTGYLIQVNILPFLKSKLLDNIISLRFLLKAKYNNPRKDKNFLYEAGIIANFEFPIYTFDNPDYDKYSISYYPDFFYGLGPLFLFGYEKHKKNYSYEFGIFFGAILGGVYNSVYHSLEGLKFNFKFIPFGIELRFNYYYFRKIR